MLGIPARSLRDSALSRTVSWRVAWSEKPWKSRTSSPAKNRSVRRSLKPRIIITPYVTGTQFCILYYGTHSRDKRAALRLEPTRDGRDASLTGDEVIAHLSGLLGSDVRLAPSRNFVVVDHEVRKSLRIPCCLVSLLCPRRRSKTDRRRQTPLTRARRPVRYPQPGETAKQGSLQQGRPLRRLNQSQGEKRRGIG